jgi:DNA-binding GntR family transcriptional regulator
MRPEHEPIRTIGERVYDVIRERIFDGELAPGDPLVLNELSAALAVSTTPVRAALARLQAEGFLQQVRRQGPLVVTPLEIEDFEEIQAVRTGIEPFAASLGAAMVDDQALATMRTEFARLKTLPRDGSPQSLSQWFTTEWHMHEACYAAAGRVRLVALVFDYRQRAERYLRLAVASSPEFQTPLKVQANLLAACEARDGDAAGKVMRDALAWTVNEVRARLASSGTAD